VTGVQTCALPIFEKQIAEHVEKLRHDLKVLKDGGTVKQVVYLNVEGRDQMIREVRFRPTQDASAFVMELIEIDPLLDQVNEKTHGLRLLVSQRSELREKQDRVGLYELERRITTYLKYLPPFFFRLNENANRLFFESSDRLKKLELQIATERERYKLMESLSVVLVIVVATLAGILFARQIRDSNQRLHLAWEKMRNAKEEAERASRAKSDFVSRMSHELRTPMNAILGFAQLLQEEDINAEQRDYVNEINRAGVHLLELINQVLDLAKIEAGSMTLENIAFDPMQTVDEVATIVSEHARAKGLTLRFFASPELPARILGDPTRLRQVLINLMGNAVKFTDKGSIDLRVEPSAAGERILFSVQDTGIGMDEISMARLFRAFSQADESTTRKYGGTGLGLMISKDLVQAMGGDIEVESTPGLGSRFWFSLPARMVDDAPRRAAPLTGYHALLSCSEAHQVEALTAQLKALGAEVIAACGMQEIQRKMADNPDEPWVFIGQPSCLSELTALQNENMRGRHIVLQLPGGKMDSGTYDGCLVEPFTYSRLLEMVREIQARRVTPLRDSTAPMDRLGRNGHTRGRVLLVEDNRINQMVATRMLDKLGLQHDLAENGRIAMEMLAAKPFDLVLMDVQMPVMDGMEATRGWRAHELAAGMARIPVIAMTANAIDRKSVV
jgi:signal transduction histidine kinase/CheY-like chemotaxis protein